MRGNLDPKYVKPEEPAKPEAVPVPQAFTRPDPVVSPVTVDTQPIADALMRASVMQSQALSQAMQQLTPGEPIAAPTKWNFRVTERDRMGNIISFTAEAK